MACFHSICGGDSSGLGNWLLQLSLFIAHCLTSRGLNCQRTCSATAPFWKWRSASTSCREVRWTSTQGGPLCGAWRLPSSMATALQRQRAMHLYRHSLKAIISWAVRREIIYEEVSVTRESAARRMINGSR